MAVSRIRSGPPSPGCFDVACESDGSQHCFFMTAYLIDLSDKTVCVRL